MKHALVLGAISCLLAMPALAVGPEIPSIPKYTSFQIRGVVTHLVTIPFGGVGSCPTGYEEQVARIFVSMEVGSVAVRIPESISPPSEESCVLVTGMLLPSCHPNDFTPLAVATHVAEDDTCD